MEALANALFYSKVYDNDKYFNNIYKSKELLIHSQLGFINWLYSC
jgi:hypothetical protein